MNQIVDQGARDLAEKAAFSIEAHERECRAMRRSQEQWQESATKLLEQFRLDMGTFRADLNGKVDSWNKFIMTTLSTLLGGMSAMCVWLIIHFVIK